MEDFLTQAFIRLRERLSPSSEDALQEAFCRLWKRKVAFRDERHAESSLALTSRNIFIDEYRKKKRVSFVGIEGKNLEYEEDVSKEGLFRRVEAELERSLSPLQRDVIRRHEYEGESFEDIAKDLGMTGAAVRMQVSRARKILRDRFNESDDRL